MRRGLVVVFLVALTTPAYAQESIGQARIAIDCDSVDVIFVNFADAPANSAEVIIGIDPGGGGTDKVTWDGPSTSVSWPVNTPEAPIAQAGTIVDVEVSWDTNGQQGRILTSETLGECNVEPTPTDVESLIPALFIRRSPPAELPAELAYTGINQIVGLSILVVSLFGIGLYARGEGTRRSRPLTPHLTEILALIAEGKTNRQIAEILGLAEPTVADQVDTIFLRLDARHRAHAVAIALREGILR